MMIPAASLILWLMALFMKMSKKIKKCHPEDGKCELYQVIQVVFKQKYVRIFHSINCLKVTINQDPVNKSSGGGDCYGVCVNNVTEILDGASQLPRKRSLEKKRVGEQPTGHFEHLTFCVIILILCKIKLIRRQTNASILQLSRLTRRLTRVHSVSCENYLDGIFITSC